MWFIALIFLALISCAHAQVPMTGAGLGAPSSGGGVTLSLDGSAVSGGNTVTLSTTQSNDLIIIDISSNAGPITNVTSLHLTFSLHGTNGAGEDMERWYAVASSPLSSELITITGSVASAIVYGINGAHTASPFDSGGPVTASGGGGSDPVSITTSNANTMVIGGFRLGSASSTAGSGFTLIQSADFAISEYKIISSAQTLSVTLGSGAGGANGAIVDAVIQGP